MSQTVMRKNNTWQKLQKVLKGGKNLENAMIKSTLLLLKTRNSFFFVFAKRNDYSF